MRAWWMLACTGCVVSSTDDTTPSRFIGELSPRVGIAHIEEPATDGATGRGTTVGFRLDGMYRVHPRFALGIGVDVSFSGHDTMVEERTASYWWVYLPVLATRVDLGRFAFSTWTGYYIGSREITEPGCYFDPCTVASQDLHGGALGTAGFLRFATEGAAFELGPYLQTHWAYAKEDDGRTPFDEGGMRVRSLAIGLALQIALGAPTTN